MERGWTASKYKFYDSIDLTISIDSNALYLLVYVSQRLIFAEESGGTLSYLDETLKKALIHIRRLFDKFIVSGSGV